MLKNKKLILISMLILLLILSVACSGEIDDSKGAVDKDGGTNSKTADEEKDNKYTLENVSIGEEVLLDEEGIKIITKSINLNGIFGPEIELLIENNSDEGVTIQTEDSSINQVMVEFMISAEVGAGKKLNESITIMHSNLKDSAISVIKDIELKFIALNTETFDRIFESAPISIKTDADPAYVQNFDDSGVEIVNDNDVRIVVKKVNSSDSFWGADVYVFIENNNDKDLLVQAREVSINGFMIDPIFSSSILSGKKAFASLTFMEEDLKKNKIESIDEMELSFNIIDLKSWEDIHQTDLLKVNFE